MMSGKDLKQMLSLIPDNAVVIINGNENVDITGISVSNWPDSLTADLRLTEGYSIVIDSVLNDLFVRLKER